MHNFSSGLALLLCPVQIMIDYPAATAATAAPAATATATTCCASWQPEVNEHTLRVLHRYETANCRNIIDSSIAKRLPSDWRPVAAPTRLIMKMTMPAAAATAAATTTITAN